MENQAKYAAFIVSVLIFLQGIYLVYRGDWSSLYVAGAALLFSTLPFLLFREYDFKVSWKIQAGIAAFLFATLILGEIHRFYTEILWWDMLVHLLAGIGLTLIGYRILFRLVYEKAISATPVIHTLFTSFTAISILALWEVYEFTIDTLGWAENKMQPSNTDTMTDIVVGVIGILLVSLPGYYFLSKQNREMKSKEI
jgi:hypothetical protein